MPQIDPDEFWRHLDDIGADEVRDNLVRHAYGPTKKRLANEWLDRHHDIRNKQKAKTKEYSEQESLKIAKNHNWAGRWIIYIAFSILLATFFYHVIRLETNVPQYAVLSKDGQIIAQQNFGKYGLFVRQKGTSKESGEKHVIKNSSPKYMVSFESEPDYFEITTKENAVPKVINKGNRTYEVYFLDAGSGKELVKCDFKIQAY